MGGRRFDCTNSGVRILSGPVLSKGLGAVKHRNQYWGYPISFEVVGLIYNKRLVDTPPAQLSDLVAFNQRFKQEHPGLRSILWDYNSPYYSWGILASAEAERFRQLR